MGELLDVTCDVCGEPMVPRREHAGRRRLRLDLPEPRLPGAGGRGLEAEDLAGAGVSTSSGTGSDVEDEALAGRLARLVCHYVDGEEACGREADAPARTRSAEGAGALAGHLSDSLVVSYHSDEFAEAQDARQALAAAGALCAVLRRTAGDAQDRLAVVDADLPGLLTIGEV